MEDLTSTEGIVALVALGVAAIALLCCGWLTLRLRRVRGAQRAVLGESGARDVVEHARKLQERVEATDRRVGESHAALSERLTAVERSLERAIAHSSVLRYDAYNEMSGRQSSTIALLDAHADGLVLSSIHQRDQARFYAKAIAGGESPLELSPEEREAIDRALGRSEGEEAEPAGET